MSAFTTPSKNAYVSQPPSPSILRRIQEASKSNRIRNVMDCMEKARSIIDIRTGGGGGNFLSTTQMTSTTTPMLSTASQLALELDLHGQSPRPQKAKTEAMLMLAYRRFTLSNAMNLWLSNGHARAQFRCKYGEVLELLELQQAVMSGVDLKLQNLQSLLHELRQGKLDALRLLLPGVRDDSWKALLEEVETLLTIFQARVDAVQEHNRSERSSFPPEATTTVAAAHAGPTLAMCRLLGGKLIRARRRDAVVCAVRCWRMGSAMWHRHRQQLKRALDGWWCELHVQRVARQKRVMQREKILHAEELAELHTRIAKLQKSASFSPSNSPLQQHRHRHGSQQHEDFPSARVSDLPTTESGDDIREQEQEYRGWIPPSPSPTKNESAAEPSTGLSSAVNSPSSALGGSSGLPRRMERLKERIMQQQEAATVPAAAPESIPVGSTPTSRRQRKGALLKALKERYNYSYDS